jgi:long-chain acyl-CoA synthetase
VKDAYRGETVKAFIVLRTGLSVSGMQLDSWCRSRLAAFKVPHQYEFRSELPMSMIGKVLRRKLQEEAETSRSAAVEAGEVPPVGDAQGKEVKP